MSKRLAFVVPLFAAFILLLPASAQENGSATQSTSICTFEDGNEISVRYQPVEFNKKNEPTSGKPWAPDGNPILLFTPTSLIVANTAVPTGAYALYVIRNKSEWTLIINKNVTQGAAYDPSQDLVRVDMESTKIENLKPLNVSLGHIQPKVCSLQFVFGDLAGWANLQEK